MYRIRLLELIPKRVSTYNQHFLNSTAHLVFTHRLNSRQLLRTIADNNIDDVYASIFDVHMNGDIALPTRAPNLALIGSRSLRALPPPVLPVVSFGRGTFSIEGMGIQRCAVG